MRSHLPARLADPAVGPSGWAHLCDRLLLPTPPADYSDCDAGLPGRAPLRYPATAPPPATCALLPGRPAISTSRAARPPCGCASEATDGRHVVPRTARTGAASRGIVRRRLLRASSVPLLSMQVGLYSFVWIHFSC